MAQATALRSYQAMVDLTYDPEDHWNAQPCSACGKAIPLNQPALFRNGEMYHMRCWSGWLRGDAMDQQDRARRAKARAAAIIAVSRRLLARISEEVGARPGVRPPIA